MPSQEHMPKHSQTSAGPDNENAWFELIQEAILDGDAENAISLVKGALANGIESDDILKKAVITSMSAVGRDFKNGEFYIPDVLMSSRASHAALFAMRGNLASFDPERARGKVVVGTVAGDLHDIGKNIAVLMLQCDQIEVIDLGIDVVPERFVEAVKTHKPDVLGLSALLTTTMSELSNVIAALEQAGVRESVKVYVSGLPVTQEFADETGADHYCENARDTVEYVRMVLEQAKHN